MKTKLLKALLIIETTMIAIPLFWLCFSLITYKDKELFREISPNGDYVLYIEELGDPDWPFGADHLGVTLFENNKKQYYRVSFHADVSNDGAPAHFEVEWMEDGVQVILKGSEQPDAYYILPFRTLED